MFTRRFFILFVLCILLAFSGFFWAPMLTVAEIAFALLVVATLVDGALVTYGALRIRATRQHGERMSHSQPNAVTVSIALRVPKRIDHWFNTVAYDSCPETFEYKGEAEMHGTGTFTYHVIPRSRGRHEFGVVRCFVTSKIGLSEGRRFVRCFSVAKVYPTYLHLDKLEINSTHDTSVGQQRTRRAGNNTNFEQIRAYVKGDDVRTINWKATARAASLMVNTYTDERSQAIIPILCAGPSMQIATEGVSLLDRAASAAVALAASAVRHYDEAGLITATHSGVRTYLKPERSMSTVAHILEYTCDFGLEPTPTEREMISDPDVVRDDVEPAELEALRDRMYSCQADTDFDALSRFVDANIKRRSLLVLFANFENIEVAKQTLPALLRMARRHKLVVVLFTNEGVEEVAYAPYRSDRRASQKLSELRFRTVCTDYLEQQMVLASHLQHCHINVVHTSPKCLTSAILQEYFEIKRRSTLSS